MSELTNDELRKLAEGARSTIKWGHALGQFRKVATPERILALLDEVDHLLEMHVSLLAIRPTRGELRAENERLRALVSGELTASELQLFNVFASVKDVGVLPATVFQIAGLRRLEEIPPYNPNSVKDGDA